jgi:hypothetical protein
VRVVTHSIHRSSSRPLIIPPNKGSSSFLSFFDNIHPIYLRTLTGHCHALDRSYTQPGSADWANILTSFAHGTTFPSSTRSSHPRVLSPIRKQSSHLETALRPRLCPITRLTNSLHTLLASYAHLIVAGITPPPATCQLCPPLCGHPSTVRVAKLLKKFESSFTYIPCSPFTRRQGPKAFAVPTDDS